MKAVLDLHIHSKYSAATSKDSGLEGLSEWATLKGINVLATGDFTHPIWFKELKQKLKDAENGLFSFRNQKFILNVEVSNIFERNKKTVKIHTVVFTDSFESAEQVIDYLSKHGKLSEDGRPTLNLDAAEMIEQLSSLSKTTQFMPAHVWTPWFSLYGSKFGVDSIKQAFLDKAGKIVALETGLSSDPGMNWRYSDTEPYAIVSNSDAHSPQKLGREANVFDVQELSYKSIFDVMKTKKGFVKTYELFPQEGKYFWDGHRNCNFSTSPEEGIKFGNICPVCKRPLTIGVMHRIEKLADRPANHNPKNAVPFQHIIPLPSIIAKTMGSSEATQKVQEYYMKLIRYFGSEFDVFEAPLEKLMLATEPEIARALYSIYKEKVFWKPGYDGVFGEFSLEPFPKEKRSQKRLGEF